MLDDLRPKKVFGFFEELTKIPRCSGNEQQVSDYLVSFAKERDLEVIQDLALNVIIKKPGTTGYESSPTVIIQGHSDMVCERSKGSSHDFSRDPIPLKVDGDLVRTHGTTLGADNGIAVAYGLAVLDSADIPHPPIELLVTTSEETGMGGAFALDASGLKGARLLNIDAEDEGVLFVSCAGGVDLLCTLDTVWEAATGGALQIEVSGLKGGHSGLEIVQQRANAIKLLGRVLDAARGAGEFNISAVAGGSKSNAIAREAQATIIADAPVLEKIKTIVDRVSQEVRLEFAAADPDAVVTAAPAEKSSMQLDGDSTNRLIDFLMVAPHGVQTMSKELPDLVESSLNLGVLKQEGESIELIVSVRSSVNSIREDIVRRIEVLARLVRARSERTGEYPAWRYEAESELRDVCVSVYRDLFGSDPQIQAIHAGLECGLLREKLPETDMISFGPNLRNVHTPEEELSISSVANTWEFLTAILANLK